MPFKINISKEKYSMSRKITIRSTKQILEKDLALEVVSEMLKNNQFNLKYDINKQVFISEQIDDHIDKSILDEAEKLYYLKVQKRREEQLESKLKKNGYIVEKIKQDGKIKIIAKQRIYT